MKLFIYITHLLALPMVVLALDKPELVSFDFRCLAMSKELRMKELYVGYAEATERYRIRLNDQSKTEVYSYRGAPQLYFYDQASGGSVLASYRYQPEQEMPLLLFYENVNAQSLPYNVVSIEDSWSDLGPGSCLLVNLTSKALYWKFGEERFKVDSKAQRRIDSADAAKTQVIALEADKNGKPARVYRAYLRNQDNMRRLMFVRDTTENEVGSVRVKVIQDFYVPKAASVDED